VHLVVGALFSAFRQRACCCAFEMFADRLAGFRGAQQSFVLNGCTADRVVGDVALAHLRGQVSLAAASVLTDDSRRLTARPPAGAAP
jgi:hypothetical protein